MSADPQQCLDHLDFTNDVCPDCGEPVDAYGNTEYQFDRCSFPDCGCDGARLCSVGEPSSEAEAGCVEGMWTGKTREQREAVFRLIGQCCAAEAEATGEGEG